MSDMVTQGRPRLSNQPAFKPRRRRRMNADRWIALGFILPSIILIAVFVYGFIGWTGYVSLSQWNSFLPDFSFAGFDNYAYIFKNFRFQADLRNTIFFTLFFIIAVVILGLVLAIFIDQKLKAESLFRNIFLFPMALSFVVTGVVWRWVLSPSTGVNLFLEHLGIHLKWYTSTAIFPHIHIGMIDFGIPAAVIPVVIAATWQQTGFSLAMFLAGLRGIPDELREAARMDGATELQIYWKVILPQLKPIMFSVIIIMAHISLKIFDLIYTMTGSGANYVTDMPGVNMFETTFKANYYAQGAAIAMIMLLLVAIFIVPYLIKSRKGDA